MRIADCYEMLWESGFEGKFEDMVRDACEELKRLREGENQPKQEQSKFDQLRECVDMKSVCAALGFDPTNHHNAAKCPYCQGASAGSEQT